MMGLRSSIIIARKARCVLTSTLWVEHGLVNGAVGTIKHIIFEPGQKPPSLPSTIIVKFDNYRGPCINNQPGLLLIIYRSNKANIYFTIRCVAVPVKTATLETQSGRLERTQFPISLAFALTIHKSQGLTLPSATVDIGKDREMAPGLTFVGISRVRRIQDLQLMPFDFLRLKKIKLSQNMIEHDKQTQVLIEQTKVKYRNMF